MRVISFKLRYKSSMNADTPSRITTIVHFSMPKENVDEFIKDWTRMRDIMLAQPGALDGALHRTIDDDSPFQVINVAHWSTPQALADALRVTGEEFERSGTPLPELFKRLNVRVSQNNYREDVKY